MNNQQVRLILMELNACLSKRIYCSTRGNLQKLAGFLLPAIHAPNTKLKSVKVRNTVKKRHSCHTTDVALEYITGWKYSEETKRNNFGRKLLCFNFSTIDR